MHKKNVLGGVLPWACFLNWENTNKVTITQTTKECLSTDSIFAIDSRQIVLEN